VYGTDTILHCVMGTGRFVLNPDLSESKQAMNQCSILYTCVSINPAMRKEGRSSPWKQHFDDELIDTD
jgi:hypothetical protein